MHAFVLIYVSPFIMGMSWSGACEYEKLNSKIVGLIQWFPSFLLQKDDKGLVWVHNNKQGFQDCEVYAELEKWLGARTDEYLDKYVNKLQLVISYIADWLFYLCFLPLF